jgi:hypothetical protein
MIYYYHTVKWDFNFSQEDAEKYGVGTAYKIT